MNKAEIPEIKAEMPIVSYKRLTIELTFNITGEDKKS